MQVGERILHSRKTRLGWALVGRGGKEGEHYSCGCRKKTKVGSFFTQEKVWGCSEEESEKAKPENKPSELSKALWLGKQVPFMKG